MTKNEGPINAGGIRRAYEALRAISIFCEGSARFNAPRFALRVRVAKTEAAAKRECDASAWSRFLAMTKGLRSTVSALKDQAGDSKYSDKPNQLLVTVYDQIRSGDAFLSLRARKLFIEDGTVEDVFLEWEKVILGAACGSETMSRLADIGLAALAAGWMPIIWRGDFPDGYLVIYPLPGSVNVPAEWLVGSAEVTAVRPILAKAIPRSTLPLSTIPAANPVDWVQLLKRKPDQAVRAALQPLVDRSAAGVAVVKDLVARSTSVALAGSKSKPELLLGFTTKKGRAVTLRCAAPWTGELTGLPALVAQVIRQHNGMVLEDAASKPRWLPYAKMGFAVDWKVWEIKDPATEPAAWRSKPLAPFTNGQDLWVYHPARRMSDSLELVKLDHETDGWEAEPVQHPGVRFLQVVASVLAAS